MGISAIYSNVAILRIIFFLFLIVSVPATANNTQEQTREFCRQLINESEEDTDSKNYSTALEKLLKAEVIAEQQQWNDLLWDIKNRIGVVHFNISNFGEALSYLQESFAITQKNKELKENAAPPLINIGLLFAVEKKYEEAIHYYKKAYDAVKNREGAIKKHIACSMAEAYIKTNQVEKCLEVLDEVKGEEGKPQINFLWQALYIEAIFKSGQVLKAKDMADSLYDELNKSIYDDKVCHTCLNDLQSKIYAKLGEIDMAIYYSRQGLNSTDESIDKIDFYKNISDLYFRKGELNTALLYKDSVIQATDSLSVQINRHLYEANKVKFKTQEYQNQLKVEKERQKKQKQLFIAIVVFVLVFSFFIYKGLKNKVIRQKQEVKITSLAFEKEKKERLLSEKQLEVVKGHALLKQEQLKNEIAEKNRELAAKALHLTNRNKLVRDIIDSLENNNIVKNRETAQQIRMIKNFLKTDNHSEDFIKHFESVNPSFLKKLKGRYPELNANDVRFLCYIFMNLSLKEISIIFNITYDASKKRNNRIMNKMRLDKNISLYDYLLNL